MPSKTALTREQIEQQAAELAAQVEAFREQDRQRQEEEQRRRAAAERACDEQFAADYSRQELDTAVDRARAAFQEALAENPLVLALADYLTAMQRARTLTYEYAATLGRLGRGDRAPAAHSYPIAELGPVEDYIASAVARLVAERVDAETAERTSQRQAAIDAAAQQG
jgi:hypothetical protein